MTHNSLYAVMLLATTTWVLILHHPPLVRNSLSHPNPSLPESEAGAESREVAVAALPGSRLTQAEEGVTLDGALPQVFAGLGVGQLEYKSVLLFPTLEGPKRTKKSVRHVRVCCYFASRTQTWSSSSTTTSVSRLLLKSSRVILGLDGKNNGLYVSGVIARLGPYIFHQQQHPEHHVRRPQDKKNTALIRPHF